jgi:hypothetical protein
VTIPARIERLNVGCFYAAERISNVIFESEIILSSIEMKAFRNCTLLSSIRIPSAVERLGETWFEECASLLTVTFTSGPSLELRGFRVSKKLHFAGVHHFRQFTFRVGFKHRANSPSIPRICLGFRSRMETSGYVAISSWILSENQR